MIAEETPRRHAPNPLGNRRRLLLALGDRRLNRRYPIAAELEYRAVGNDGVTLEGIGQTINLSTGGVLFQSDQALRVGLRIELAINWPARLNDSLALNLCVSGRVSRSEGNCHAVRIRAHEFCLRGRYRLAGPRFRNSALPEMARAAAAQPLSL
jgi:hypothetical protein